MEFPTDRKYSKEHTWISVHDNTGTIGITEFAQSELGEIVYADLPNIGYSFQQDEVFGSVEAVKTVSDLFLPMSGEIVEFNDSLESTPEKVNSDPYGEGWMIKIKVTDVNDFNSLLSSEDYKALIGA